MRNAILFGFIILTHLIYSQAPAVFPYQAVARNASGEALANTSLIARFTLHESTANGPSIWQEVQSVTTSANGLFTAQLGSVVSLAQLNWSQGSKFMQVEIDLGQGFLDLGTQQLLSVPYTLQANSVTWNVSATGDTLSTGGNQFVIIPGISNANNH